jgi:hypothetical protein
MSYSNGPQILTNGLVMYLDAANKKSYPGSGTTWYDLCGNYNGTLVSSPTFTSDFSGVVNTTGAGARVQASGINLSSGTYTIIGSARYNGSTKGRIISATGNNWLLGHWSNSVANHYAEGWVTSVGAGGSDQTWRIYAATGNSSTDNWKFYINGILNADNNGGSQGPNGIQIGGVFGTSEHSDGQCGFVIAYNRVLNNLEILENYNALKSRYGL